MRRIAALPAVLLSALPRAAPAQPSFKTAPGSEESGGEPQGSGWADFVPEGLGTESAPPWAQPALEFLANNYGYLGVAAVLLMLFLFARGAGGSGQDAGKTGGKAGAAGEDFFEAGDADGYHGGPPR